MLGTGAVTLVLLAGMPYVLWQATGLPWPEQVASWGELGDRLAEPVGDPLLVDLLALFGWVCWAAFTCSLVREAAWYAVHLPHLVRNRTVHQEHLAGLTVRGSLAALCVGTLVVALLAMWRPVAAEAHPASLAGELRAHVAATAPLVPVVASALDPAGDGSAGRCVVYTVVKGDTLWDLARTHLGDPLKWPRIYALNKGYLQDHHQRLNDPDLLMPGWELALPAECGPLPPVPAPSPPVPAEPAPASPAPSTPVAPSPSAPAPSPEKPGVPSGGTAHTGQPSSPAHGPAAIGLGTASVIGMTAAAGLLAALRAFRIHQRRTRPSRTEPAAEALSPLVERAVAAAREAAMPRTAADPDALVTRRTPPADPQPAGAVTLGIVGEREVRVDALASAGGCTWSGPGAEAAARALLCGVLTAAASCRPHPPRVRAVLTADLTERLLPGAPAEFTALTSVASSGEAVRLAEEHLIAHAHHTDESGSPSKDSDPGTLLLLTAPGTAHLTELQALAARSRCGVLAVLALDTPLPGGAHWHVEDDGTTRMAGFVPDLAGLRLFQVTAQDGHGMLDLLLGAHGQRPHLRVTPHARQPAAPPHTPGSADTPEPSDPAEAEDENPAAVDPAPLPVPSTEGPTASPAPEPLAAPAGAGRAQEKPVRLQVLGPLTLYARGGMDPIGTGLRGEAREFLALLAAHPAGLLAADIAVHLRLHGDGDATAHALKNLRRAIRRTLRLATGMPKGEFIQLQGELHKLHPGMMETDLAEFTMALNRAATAEAEERLSVLREATAYYHGPFAQGGDYPWADGFREHLASRVADAVARIAHHAEHTGDDRVQEQALALVEQTIVLHPDNEQLYQHAIRLHQVAGRHRAAQQTYSRLQHHLAGLGLEPDPALRALISSRPRA